jgi:hypothetical protein
VLGIGVYVIASMHVMVQSVRLIVAGLHRCCQFQQMMLWCFFRWEHPRREEKGRVDLAVEGQLLRKRQL